MTHVDRNVGQSRAGSSSPAEADGRSYRTDHHRQHDSSSVDHERTESVTKTSSRPTGGTGIYII